MKNFFERIFHLQAHNTTIRTEIIAGITTFLSMAYILAVNPAILSDAGMDRGGVLIATALASFAGTLFMAAFANYPFALAPSMGLNAYFTYTVVQAMEFSWQFALFAVFFEGFIFLLLSVTSIREQIFNAIPLPLKKASGIGIGFFIAFIAFQNAKLIENHEETLVVFQTFTGNDFFTDGISATLALLGTIVTACLLCKNIKGAILLGILITWGAGIICELTGLYKGPGIIPDLTLSSFRTAFDGFLDLFGAAFEMSNWQHEERSGAELIYSMSFITIVFAFLFVDLFSAIGTLTGVAGQAGLLTKEGKLPKIKGAFLADSLATSTGAVLGTSTTTTYVESATGVVAGGRTGLTATTTAVLFLLSIIFAPLLLSVPSFATAPALIIVGFYMISPIREMDFSDMGIAIPTYLTIIVMPFAYSITDGISVGIISWTVINLILKKWERLSPLMIILTLLFLGNYFFLR